MASAIRWDGDDESGAAGYAFEPLPMIAGERRLHVRAFHYWRARADERPMPTLADCHDLDRADFSGRMILIDLACGDHPARIRTIGSELAADMATGREPGMAPGRSGLVDELIARLPTVALQRAPIGFEAEAPECGGAGCCFRGILLPLADETGAIAHILGVMSWREIVATVPGAEIMAALASLPTAPCAAQAPSPWALVATTRRTPAPPSIEERIATARTWVAVAGTDRLRARTHLHAAIGAAHDALADLPAADGRNLLHALFDGAADVSHIERIIAHARLLAIGGRALADRLDDEADGVAGFLDRTQSAAAQYIAPSPTCLHFRLAPLGPELLAPSPRREMEERIFPARHAAG